MSMSTGTSSGCRPRWRTRSRHTLVRITRSHLEPAWAIAQRGERSAGAQQRLLDEVLGAIATGEPPREGVEPCQFPAGEPTELVPVNRAMAEPNCRPASIWASPFSDSGNDEIGRAHV